MNDVFKCDIKYFSLTFRIIVHSVKIQSLKTKFVETLRCVLPPRLSSMLLSMTAQCNFIYFASYKNSVRYETKTKYFGINFNHNTTSGYSIKLISLIIQNGYGDPVNKCKILFYNKNVFGNNKALRKRNWIVTLLPRYSRNKFQGKTLLRVAATSIIRLL